jgi:outer membrane protein assembly factor BamB
VALSREWVDFGLRGRAQRVVYFSTLHGRTYALDAATGKLLWYFRRGSYAVGVADRKRLYLLGYARIYAMEER